MTSHVALVASPDVVPVTQLTAVAAALQTQATRDFGPLWNVSATVTAFAAPEDVPVGYWPILVQRAIDRPGDDGYHTDRNNQPLALVTYADNWTLIVSHEMLEMLADPFGNRLVAGPTLDPAPERAANRVQYLLEACDPVQDARLAYTIDGIMVSDFITPQYHDPAGTNGARYDFRGAVAGPREVMANGYISWLDPAADSWFQLSFFNGVRDVQQLGLANDADAALSAREFVHGATARAKPEIPAEQAQDVTLQRDRNVAAGRAHARQLARYL